MNRQPKGIIPIRDVIDRHHRRRFEAIRDEHPAYFREPETNR